MAPPIGGYNRAILFGDCGVLRETKLQSSLEASVLSEIAQKNLARTRSYTARKYMMVTSHRSYAFFGPFPFVAGYFTNGMQVEQWGECSTPICLQRQGTRDEARTLPTPIPRNASFKG